jgi:hypothetical protein
VWICDHSHLPNVFRQIVRAPPGDFRRETSEHFRASLVVSGKRALEIWTIGVCVNGMIVDHWRGKSGNSDSLLDAELEQSPDRSKGALVFSSYVACLRSSILRETADDSAAATGRGTQGVRERSPETSMRRFESGPRLQLHVHRTKLLYCGLPSERLRG